MIRRGRKRPLEQRFWEKVDVRDEDECWPWLGGTNTKGYGTVFLFVREDRRSVYNTSNRIAYELTYGPLPEGLCACHTCDNPPCCNPKHLFAGTHMDNTIDKVNKGRARNGVTCGERNHLAKLTWEKVDRIRALDRAGVSRREIGELSGVTDKMVGYIVRGVYWREENRPTGV